MSELDSLFAKIHITKDNFDAFLKTKPTHPHIDNNWLEWWDSREMYSKTELKENNLYCYKESTNELIISGWIEAKKSMTFSEYDVENEIWYFGIIMFSENYFEMIPGLAFIKSIDKFLTKNKKNYAIVYDYFWGDDDTVMAYINYENGIGLFDAKIKKKSDIEKEIMEFTEAYLQIEFEKLSSEFDD